MASSGRARQSNPARKHNRGPTPLPPYHLPANKLSDDAQRALHNLPNNHRLDGLQQRLKHANDVLSNTAGELNDRYQQKAADHQRRQARRRAQGAESEEEDDPGVERLRHEVEDMTSRLEQSVRMIIDARAAVQGVEGALKELDANITAGRGAVAPTQSTLGASQFRQTRRKRRMRSEDEEEEESGDETVASQILGDGPAALFQKKVAENNSAYEGLSMRNRYDEVGGIRDADLLMTRSSYAANNDYVGFRKIIHDARHPEDDAPPMPNASTWFSESQEAPDVATDSADGQAAAELDNDDEIAVASERKSLKCPITLLTMVDPLSSTKCPHSFERSAILGMLDLSEVRLGGSGRRGAQDGERAMKCPECNVVCRLFQRPSCRLAGAHHALQMLTASDLQSDPVLIRRIKRLQAAEAVQEGDFDDDTENPSLARGSQKRQAEPISSDSEGEGSTTAAAPARSVNPRIKAEKLAISIKARQVSMVPNSQVQGLMREDERPQSSAGSEIVDLEDLDAEDEGE